MLIVLFPIELWAATGYGGAEAPERYGAKMKTVYRYKVTSRTANQAPFNPLLPNDHEPA